MGYPICPAVPRRWAEVTWDKLHVGDIIQLKSDDLVPVRIYALPNTDPMLIGQTRN